MNCKAQALVEYLIFMGMMAVIAVNLIKAMHGFMGSNVGGIALVLSRQLKSGVCSSTCYFANYKNETPDATK